MLAESGANQHSGLPEKGKLPRQDYLLIPFISVVTVCAMLACTEVGTRMIWPAASGLGRCLTFDPVKGFATKANCTDRLRDPEGPWVSYHYNACGYRTYAACGPKPAGTIRIALLGSSLSQGLYIPFDQTFSERAARELSRATGRTVEVQNLGVPSAAPINCYRNLNAVMALKPDLVVYPLTPIDLQQDTDVEQLAHRNDPEAKFSRPAAAFQPTLRVQLQALVANSRALLFAEHFLFSNRETYARTYLNYGDKADYLRVPLTARWQKRYADLEIILTEMSARLKQHDIPLVIVSVPSEVEAVLLHSSPLPPHVRPLAFGRALEEIAGRAGAEYADGLSEFQRVPQSERLFYIVNGHVDPVGQELIARALVRKCLDGSISAFQAWASGAPTSQVAAAPSGGR